MNQKETNETVSGRPEMIPTLWERSRPGARGVRPPVVAATRDRELPSSLLRQTGPDLPCLSELEVVRHFTGLSHLSRGVDTHFIPLGSCTMKYNPKVSDKVASLPGFADLHPRTDPEGMEGLIEAMGLLSDLLKSLLGMDAVTLAPAAGAHGELTGILIARKYFESRNEPARKVILVPDSAHGTNPASASMGGMVVSSVVSKPSGHIDTEALSRALSPETAMVMITAPSTLGLFEEELSEVVRLVHDAGALVYMDGANMNAFLGVLKPGDLGFDIVHINTHKTLATPHGGGGPGSGPVGVKAHLAPFLPPPILESSNGRYHFGAVREDCTIGPVRSFLGSVGVLLRALSYLLLLGREGLPKVALYSLLNANYLKSRLEGVLPGEGPGLCAHEFVLSAKPLAASGVHAQDLAKALLDAGYYAPTIHFPLIVPEALMIEPTECESKEMLDRFADDLTRIVEWARRDPRGVLSSPVRTPVSRPDEVLAARDPVLKEPSRPGAGSATV